MHINKVIIWGLKDRYHTHRYIHQSFFETLKKIGTPVIWVEDAPENAHLIETNDLIISSEVQGRMVPAKKTLSDYHLPIRTDIWYCLHGFQKLFLDQLDHTRFISLEVYTNTAPMADMKWGPVTYFDTKHHRLYQPWGTNLLAHEFYPPTYNRHKIIFWVGSIWNNVQNQGNIAAITELKTVLKAHGLYFLPVRFIPNWLNTFLVRQSQLAPAIAGKFQVENNYLPCRMFKNISYGQLGFSNVPKFKDILGTATVPGNTIAEMVDAVLRLSKQEYLALITRQQEIIKQYTYVEAYKNIIRAFETITTP